MNLRSDNLLVGGIYSIVYKNDGYAVTKLLALHGETAHVRLYAGVYDNRPDGVDFSSLCILPHTEPNCGFGHVPMSVESFLASCPILLGETPLADDELTYVRQWCRINNITD